jgi:hypothetical protein
VGRVVRPILSTRNALEHKMKVKFLKNGLYAHQEPGRENFPCEIGKTMSGLSEKTCQDMIDSGYAEVIGADDPEEKESTDGDNENSKSDENANGETGASGKSDDNGGKKPWATS